MDEWINGDAHSEQECAELFAAMQHAGSEAEAEAIWQAGQ
jgi:hypothetical protein